MEQNIKGQYAEQTSEQKAYKQTKETFRSEIRSLVERQKTLKETAKSGLKGKGSFTTQAQSEAQKDASLNRFTLRHHYIAYALFRGRKISETPKHVPADQSHRAKQYFKENGRNEWGFRPYDEGVVKKITEKYAAGTTVRYNS